MHGGDGVTLIITPLIHALCWIMEQKVYSLLTTTLQLLYIEISIKLTCDRVYKSSHKSLYSRKFVLLTALLGKVGVVCYI